MIRYFHERPLDRRHKAAGFMTHVLIHPETLEDIEKELTSDSFVKPLREDASRLRLHVCYLSMHRVKGLGIEDPRRFVRLGLAVGPHPGVKDITDAQLRIVRHAMYTRLDTALNQAGYALSSSAWKWLILTRAQDTCRFESLLLMC